MTKGKSAWKLVSTDEEWLAVKDVEAWGPPKVEIRQFVLHGLLDSIEDLDLVDPHAQDAHAHVGTVPMLQMANRRALEWTERPTWEQGLLAWRTEMIT